MPKNVYIFSVKDSFEEAVVADHLSDAYDYINHKYGNDWDGKTLKIKTVSLSIIITSEPIDVNKL